MTQEQAEKVIAVADKIRSSLYALHIFVAIGFGVIIGLITSRL